MPARSFRSTPPGSRHPLRLGLHPLPAWSRSPARRQVEPAPDPPGWELRVVEDGHDEDQSEPKS